jgi:hypothetical protein
MPNSVTRSFGAASNSDSARRQAALGVLFRPYPGSLPAQSITRVSIEAMQLRQLQQIARAKIFPADITLGNFLVL